MTRQELRRRRRLEIAYDQAKPSTNGGKTLPHRHNERRIQARQDYVWAVVNSLVVISTREFKWTDIPDD